MTIVEMEHMQSPSTVVSSLDQEIVVMTLTTISRLFDLGPDAAALYMFYCKTAKLQAQQIGYTNKIKATSDYCRAGLGWGSEKFHRTKQLLKDNGFVEDVMRKDSTGLVTGHYIQINYLMKNASHETLTNHLPQTRDMVLTNHLPQNQRVENEGTNAVNKNRNAVNENIYTPKTTTGHTVSPQKKAQKSHSKVSRSSEFLTEATMVPLTYEELWDIANRKNVSLKTVRFIEGQVLDMIRDGNKYKAKTVSRTVQKWIDLGIGRGNIVQMNEVERMLFDLESPQQQQALVEVAGKLKEQDLL